MSWNNTLQKKLEEVDAILLNIVRGQHEYSRRLAVLERSMALHTAMLFEDEQTVKMVCIACKESFDVPIAEAKAQEFTTVCPRCYNWALPVREIPKEYSIADLARLSGRNYGFVSRIIRESGLKPAGPGRRPFNEELAFRVLEVLKGKKRRGAAPIV